MAKGNYGGVYEYDYFDPKEHPLWKECKRGEQLQTPTWARTRQYVRTVYQSGRGHEPGTQCRIENCRPLSNFNSYTVCDLHFEDGSSYIGLSTGLVDEIPPLELLALQVEDG